MRVERPSGGCSVIGPSIKTTPIPQGIASAGDAIEEKNRVFSFLNSVIQFFSNLFRSALAYFQTLFQSEKKEEKPPEPMQPLPIAPAPAKKKEVFNELLISQGYCLKNNEPYHQFLWNGKKLFRLYLNREIWIEHVIFPKKVPCMMIESVSDLLDKIKSEHQQQIRAHIVNLLTPDIANLSKKETRLVIIGYQSPMIKIVENAFKRETKFKRDQKEYTLFKLV